MIRNKLNQRQTTKIVTAQNFSILYYACAVWLTPSISKKNLGRIESLHFRSLRLILKDYRQWISRNIITETTKRLPPDKWMKYTMSSVFLNMFHSQQPKPLLDNMMTNFYTKRRKEGYYYTFDSSATKIEKKISRNWLGTTLYNICSPWSNRQMSKDAIRVLLKKSYYN